MPGEIDDIIKEINNLNNKTNVHTYTLIKRRFRCWRFCFGPCLERRNFTK